MFFKCIIKECNLENNIRFNIFYFSVCGLYWFNFCMDFYIIECGGMLDQFLYYIWFCSNFIKIWWNVFYILVY